MPPASLTSLKRPPDSSAIVSVSLMSSVPFPAVSKATQKFRGPKATPSKAARTVPKRSTMTTFMPRSARSSTKTYGRIRTKSLKDAAAPAGIVSTPVCEEPATR